MRSSAVLSLVAGGTLLALAVAFLLLDVLDHDVAEAVGAPLAFLGLFFVGEGALVLWHDARMAPGDSGRSPK